MFKKIDPCHGMSDSVMVYRNSIELGGRKRNFAFETCINIINFQQMNFFFIQWNSHVFLYYYPLITTSLLTSIFGTLLSIYEMFPFFPR